MFNTDEFVRDLAELCSFDSGRGNREGIRKVIDWFRPRYEALGFFCLEKTFEDHDEAPLLIVSNSKDVEHAQLDTVFVSHMDTVFDSETVAGWPLTVDENNIAHGPGVVDCKGGCLLEYYLLREMHDANEIDFSFAVIMNSDEEPGSLYSHMFMKEFAGHTKYCMVFEPGRAGREFVGVRKGGEKYKVTVHGKGAHSGVDFFSGANAIVELAKWIPEFTSIISEKIGTTVNIAEFHGGLNNGQVPDLAELTMRLLYLDPHEIDKMEAILRKTETPFDSRCRIEISRLGVGRPPMYMTENSKKLFSALDEAGKETGVDTTWITTGGMSDGNWFSTFGTGVLDGCGPCGGKLHTVDEYMEVDSVEPRFRIMRQLLLNLFH